MKTWSKRRPSTSGSPAKTPPNSRGRAWPWSPSLPSSRGSAKPRMNPITARGCWENRWEFWANPWGERMFCWWFTRGWISKILLHKQKKKIKKKNFFNWERLYYGSNIRSFFFFSCLFSVSCFSSVQPNVFFETNTGLTKEMNRFERERECWEELKAVGMLWCCFLQYFYFLGCFQKAFCGHGKTTQDILLKDRKYNRRL